RLLQCSEVEVDDIEGSAGPEERAQESTEHAEQHPEEPGALARLQRQPAIDRVKDYEDAEGARKNHRRERGKQKQPKRDAPPHERDEDELLTPGALVHRP